MGCKMWENPNLCCIYRTSIYPTRYGLSWAAHQPILDISSELSLVLEPSQQKMDIRDHPNWVENREPKKLDS